MRLGYLIVYVADVPRTLAFYERAFGLPRRFLHDNNLYAELETGGTALAFAAESLIEEDGIAVRSNRCEDTPAAAEIGLVTDDVTGAYDRAIAAGAHASQSPVEKPWGQTVAYVRDINGFLVELCSPIGS